MADNKPKKEKIEEENQELNINFNKPIPTIVDEYCKKAGQSPQDVGFLMGKLTENDDEDNTHWKELVELTRIYFFAGIFFANENQDYNYYYEEPNEKEDPKSGPTHYMG